MAKGLSQCPASAFYPSRCSVQAHCKFPKVPTDLATPWPRLCSCSYLSLHPGFLCAPAQALTICTGGHFQPQGISPIPCCASVPPALASSSRSLLLPGETWLPAFILHSFPGLPDGILPGSLPAWLPQSKLFRSSLGRTNHSLLRQLHQHGPGMRHLQFLVALDHQVSPLDVSVLRTIYFMSMVQC